MTTTGTKTRRKRTGTTPEVLALGLGGNEGNPRVTLAWAVDRLRHLLGDLRVSALYRTAPISGIPQPDYLNAVVAAALPRDLDPRAVLAFGKSLEARAGRRPTAVAAPRPLDVDLLVWGGVELETPELTLPHPRLRARRFVLQPLADVAPDLALPPDGKTVDDALREVAPQRVEVVDWPAFSVASPSG